MGAGKSERRDVVVMVAVFVVAFAIFVTVLFVLSSWRCRKMVDITGRNTEYHLPGGCFVVVNGELVPEHVWLRLDD